MCIIILGQLRSGLLGAREIWIRIMKFDAKNFFTFGHRYVFGLAMSILSGYACWDSISESVPADHPIIMATVFGLFSVILGIGSLLGLAHLSGFFQKK
jgi:hypothetical protein